MVTGSFTWNRISKRSLFSVLLLFVFACKERNFEKNNPPPIDMTELESGDLVCRLGNGFFSNLFRKFASEEQKYSHIGILSIEQDSAYVYHSEASELTGIGFVKRQKLTRFLKDIKVYDFFAFEFPDSTKSQILKKVQEYYLKNTPFDLDFDSFDDSKVYCTELIATAINKTFDSVIIKPGLVLNNKKFFALDNLYQNENVRKIETKIEKAKQRNNRAK